MKFFFKARDKKGELKEGSIEASSKNVAVDVLQKNELFPISINEDQNKNDVFGNVSKIFNGVSHKELMLFFRQLAILIEANVPIVNALRAIENQIDNIFFRTIVRSTINDVQDGLPFSDALNKNDKIFSRLVINVIKSGESSGNLKKSVDYVADSIEKNYSLTRKVKSALIYPAIIMIVFFVIGFLVITFVVPKLLAVIKDYEVEKIPWYTQVVINVSDFMANYWWLIPIVVMGVAAGVLYYLKTKDGKKDWDYAKLRLPVIGSIFRNLYIARFADNLAVLLAGDIPIVKAITLVSAIINNSIYEELLLKVADEVRVGRTMSGVMEKSIYIPPIVLQMIKIGEESGQIDLVLKQIAKYYEQETDTACQNLSVLIEPVIMIIIGLGVGVLVFSILMPIYNIAGQI